MPRARRLFGVSNGCQSPEGAKVLQLPEQTGAYHSIEKLQAHREAAVSVMLIFPCD